MSKELEAFLRIEKSSKRYKGRKDDLDAVFTAIRNCETERSLRINLENINYELVREKEKNQRKLKALEIIKETFDFSVEIGSCPDGTITYRLNVWCKGTPVVCRNISKDKYDLLKEVLL